MNRFKIFAAIVPLIIVAAGLFSSCGKEQTPLSQEEITSGTIIVVFSPEENKEDESSEADITAEATTAVKDSSEIKENPDKESSSYVTDESSFQTKADQTRKPDVTALSQTSASTNPVITSSPAVTVKDTTTKTTATAKPTTTANPTASAKQTTNPILTSAVEKTTNAVTSVASSVTGTNVTSKPTEKVTETKTTQSPAPSDTFRPEGVVFEILNQYVYNDNYASIENIRFNSDAKTVNATCYADFKIIKIGNKNSKLNVEFTAYDADGNQLRHNYIQANLSGIKAGETVYGCKFSVPYNAAKVVITNVKTDNPIINN